MNTQGVRQNQSLFRVLEMAKRVIKASLPIKCVEAVYLAIYLTQSMTGTSLPPPLGLASPATPEH